MQTNNTRKSHTLGKKISLGFTSVILWLSSQAGSLAAETSRHQSQVHGASIPNNAAAASAVVPLTTNQPKTSDAISAEELQKQPAPQALSETERELIGTWQGTTPISLGDGSVVERYFFSLEANGIYQVRAQVRRTDAGTDAVATYLVNTGRWSASRGLYTMVLTHAGDGTLYNMSSPKAATVHLIRELSPTHLVIQLITTGQTMKMKRVVNQSRAAS